MSRTKHARHGKDYPAWYMRKRNHQAWWRKHVTYKERPMRLAERAAQHDDEPTVLSPRARRVAGYAVDLLWDYDDLWAGADEDGISTKIPGYWEWRYYETWEWRYYETRDYDPDDHEWEPYDSDYGWDDRGPEPLDEQWVELWVDGYEDTPRDWRDDSREYDLLSYEEEDREEEWMAIADELVNGPRMLPDEPELRADIPRAAERAIRRERRRAARAA